jgi:hypothetical protein
MRYTDFLLQATHPRILKSEEKETLSFNLLAPGIFDEPITTELDRRALNKLKEQASSDEADWTDALALGEALAAALLPPVVW